VSTVKTPVPKRGVSKNPAPRSRRSPWTECTSHGVRILQVNALDKLPWLAHGFSTRPGGVSALAGRSAVAQEKVEQVLNLGFAEWDSRENVLENRRRFQSALGAGEFALISLKQFHSDVVHVFETAPAEPCRGDASATNQPGLLLGVQTADCVPILLVDPRSRAVAAVHAGWRGTLQRIVMKAIGKMQMEFATKPADLLAALGPAIGGCCYEVGTEVASAFLARFPIAAEWFDELRTGDEPNPLQWLNMMPPGHQPPPNKVLLDLKKANRAQLLEAGVPEENIFITQLCTSCDVNRLFSYRKEGPSSGRLMSVIGIRP
jgi:polyphenol oxidase